MGLYIFFVIVIALSLLGLLVLFVYKAKETYTKRKRFKFSLSIIGALIDIGFLINLLIDLFPYTIDGSLEQSCLCTLVFTLLTWIATTLVKKGWKKALLLVSPIFFFGLIVYIGSNAVFGGTIPMTKAEALYTDNEQLCKLIGEESLPEMVFIEGWQGPYYSVNLKLKDDTDREKLSCIFENLKSQHPLQIMESNRNGKIYMTVDHDQNRFANVKFNNSGITVDYGRKVEEHSAHLGEFDAIDASLPRYNVITYFRGDHGSNWSFKEKVEFVDTIPISWIEQVKKTAQKDKKWRFEESEEAYNIKFRDDHYQNYFIDMKLYKDLNGERKIADLEFGKH